jgi:hypothetical protein
VRKYIAGNMPSSFPTEIETMLSSISRGEQMTDSVSKSNISEIVKDGDPRTPMFAEAKTKKYKVFSIEEHSKLLKKHDSRWSKYS